MSNFKTDLLLLILQFFDEEKYKETRHSLEKETGVFFDIRYFEDVVTNGEWDDAEKYLSGFTMPDDNMHSMKIFFEIRKCKFLNAITKGENSKAVEDLREDLKVFSTYSEEFTLPFTFENLGEKDTISNYGDAKSAMAKVFAEIKQCIVKNPMFHHKLQFPTLDKSILRTLIKQALNWQHHHCKNPNPKPDIETLLVNHTCDQPNGARAPSTFKRDLVLLILQFLDEEKYKETLHILEKESRFFFDMSYFEDAVTNGEWDDAERYLSGFTKPDDNLYSRKVFFEIRKCQFMDALDREDDTLFMYGDAKSDRAKMFAGIKNYIVENPMFHNKLQFPTLDKSILRTLIVHALNWQHLHCKNPSFNPGIDSILVNHTCYQPKGLTPLDNTGTPLHWIQQGRDPNGCID